MNSLNAAYYTDGGSDSKSIANFRNFFYNANYTQNSFAQQQAYVDSRFKAGDQAVNGWTAMPTSLSNSSNLYFNQIQKHVNLMTGHQRQNRKSTYTQSRNRKFDSLANSISKLFDYTEDADLFQEIHSESFDAAVTQGRTLLEVYPDYSCDPYSPDFVLSPCTRVNYIIDVNSKRLDLKDCQGLWRRSWLSKKQIAALMPEREKEIDKLKAIGYRDDKFPLQKQLQDINISNLHAYDEFYYLDYRDAIMIEDPVSQEAFEFIRQPWEPEDTIDYILSKQPWLKVRKAKKETVKLNISVDNREFYNGPNLLGIDRYPFAQYICYLEADLNSSYRERGVVRDLRDCQWLLNRIRILQLKMLESQPNSGWIYPVDAVVDERAFRQTDVGVLIPLKKGHTKDEIEKIQTAQIDPSIFQLSELLFQDFEKISGINSELFGIGEDDAAGILAMMRRASGVVTLQSIFDKCDLTQRMLGQIKMEAMQKNWTPQKIKNILGEDIDPRFFLTDISKYNISVQDGPYSATQRQTEFKQVLYLREVLQMPISNQMIINKSLVFDKEELIQDMDQQQQQQAQQMEAQAQKESEKMAAENILKIAQAKVDIARARDLQFSAEERKAKVVELFASAEQKEASSDLDVVEKLMKLEDMNFNQLKNNFELAQAIKQSKSGGNYAQA